MPQASTTPRRTAPSSTRRVRDTYTNEVYDIPWKDTTRDPDESEIEELINARKRADAPPPEKSLFQKVNQPLIRWASPAAKYLSNKLTTAGLEQLDDHTYDKDSILGKVESWNRRNIVNPGLGFMGGALEGIGDLGDELTNPIDVAATALTYGGSKAVTAGSKGLQSAIRAGASAEEVAQAVKLARRGVTAGRVGSAITGARGATNVLSGITNEEGVDPTKIAIGALEAALSVHGYKGSSAGGKSIDAAESGYRSANALAAEQAVKDAARAKQTRRASILDIIDDEPVKRAEHENPVYDYNQRRLGSGTAFHGYGDVIGDARNNPDVNAQILAEAERRGILTDPDSGRILPTRKEPNIGIASRNSEFVPEQLPSEGGYRPNADPDFRARQLERSRLQRMGGPALVEGTKLPDIDVTPLRSEVVEPAIRTRGKARAKGKGRKTKAKQAPVKQEPIQSKDPNYHVDEDDGFYYDDNDEGIYHDDDSAQGAPDPGRPVIKAEPVKAVDPYENMPEPVLEVLRSKGDQKAIQQLAKRRGETGSANLGGFIEGAKDVANKVKSRLADFVDDGTQPRGLGARLGSAAREPKSPHAPTIKKDPDFSYNGEHNIRFPNGSTTKMFYDKASQIWYHTGEHANMNTGPHSSHHSTEWAFSKDELLDKLHEKFDPDSFAAKSSTEATIDANKAAIQSGTAPRLADFINDESPKLGQTQRIDPNAILPEAIDVTSGDVDAPVPQPPPLSRRMAAIQNASNIPGSVAPSPIAQAAPTTGPKVKPTTRAEVLKGMPDSPDTRSTFSKVVDPFIKSGLTTLEEMGPAGQKISRMYKYLRAEANHEAGKRISELGQASAGFDMAERTNLFDVLDGTAQPVNPRVASAATIGRRILDETGIEAEKLGMKLALPSGKKVPFTRHQGPYAPHVFDDAFFEGSNKETLFNTLVKEGKSPDEANHIIQAIKNYGDRLIDPQHTRSLNLKGYRRDPEAINKYLGDMWQKIGEAKHFGVEDLADPVSPISELVKNTTNPQLAHRILNAQLGRTIHDAGMEKVVHQINSAQVALKLPLFAISNLSQRATPLLKASADDYLKAVSSVISDKAGAKVRAEVSGSLQAVNKQLFQDSGGESRISRIFQMRRSETANRVFTSEVGRNTADRLFSELKNNPTNKLARKQLDDLLLEDVDTVLKQTNLSDKQKSIASYRMNELTQGITDNIDLPELWGAHPSVKLLTLFRKFAFVQTKILKDAIKENPARNIPLALFAYTVAGEAVGDTKTAISSLVSGKDTKEELAKRGQYKEIGKITARIMNSENAGKITGRLAQDLADGFAFGLLDDAISSSLSGKPSGMAEFIGGVNVGDASRVLGGVGRGIQGIGKSVKDTIEPPVKELVRTLPFGRPLASRLFPEEESGSGGRPSRPSRPSR